MITSILSFKSYAMWQNVKDTFSTTLRQCNMLGLHTRSHKNALAINARCTIRLMVLMLLLRVVKLVSHLKHLSGCGSPGLPVQLRRFLSISRISSMSYHCLGFVIMLTRAEPRQRYEKQRATDSRPWHATIKCFATEPATPIAHGRLTHPPVFWQLSTGSSALYPVLWGRPAFSVWGCRACRKEKEQVGGREKTD